jgi:hypothetical protein
MVETATLRHVTIVDRSATVLQPQLRLPTFYLQATVSEEGHGLGHIPPLLDLSHTAGQVPSQSSEVAT